MADMPMSTLGAIYRAKDAEAGIQTPADFEAGDRGQRYPAITPRRRRNWEHVLKAHTQTGGLSVGLRDRTACHCAAPFRGPK